MFYRDDSCDFENVCKDSEWSVVNFNKNVKMFEDTTIELSAKTRINQVNRRERKKKIINQTHESKNLKILNFFHNDSKRFFTFKNYPKLLKKNNLIYLKRF